MDKSEKRFNSVESTASEISAEIDCLLTYPRQSICVFQISQEYFLVYLNHVFQTAIGRPCAGGRDRTYGVVDLAI